MNRTACLKLPMRREKVSLRSKNYHFKKAETLHELEEIFRLRHRVYCLEKRWLDPQNYIGGLERDVYDSFSVHFSAFMPSGQIIGTLRLILQDGLPFWLPVEKHFSLKNGWEGEGKGAEVSRLVVAHEHRDGKVVIGLFKMLYQYVKYAGLRNLYLVTELPLLRLLDRLCFRFEIIGEPALYMGSLVTPVRLNMKQVEEEVRDRRPEMHGWFMENQNSSINT